MKAFVAMLPFLSMCLYLFGLFVYWLLMRTMRKQLKERTEKLRALELQCFELKARWDALVPWLQEEYGITVQTQELAPGDHHMHVTKNMNHTKKTPTLN